LNSYKRVSKHIHSLALQGLIPKIWPSSVFTHSFFLPLYSIFTLLELPKNCLVLFFGMTTGCTGGRFLSSFVYFYLFLQSLDLLAFCYNMARMGIHI
jgi:hypothetical protein